MYDLTNVREIGTSLPWRLRDCPTCCVHAFYCVLALLLSSLLRRTLAQKGLELSIVKILQTLAGIKEVALLYRGPRSKMHPVITYSQLTPLQRQLFRALSLERFQSHSPQVIQPVPPNSPISRAIF